MIGYHYTDSKFAKSINKNGLKLQPILGVGELIGKDGIWIFSKKITGEVERMFVVRQMTKFDCKEVTLYKVQYGYGDGQIGGHLVEVEHTTKVEDRRYKSECTILFKPIPPSKIKKIGVFRLEFYEQK